MKYINILTAVRMAGEYINDHVTVIVLYDRNNTSQQCHDKVPKLLLLLLL